MARLDGVVIVQDQLKLKVVKKDVQKIKFNEEGGSVKMVLPLLAAGIGLAGVTAVVPGFGDKIAQSAADAVGGVLSAIIPASIVALETGYESVKETMKGREVEVITFATAAILTITSTLYLFNKIKSVGVPQIKI